MRNHETSYQVAQRVAEIATPADVARILGRPMSTVYRRLSGETPFTVAELLQVAKGLGVPVSALLDADPALTHRGGQS